VRSHKELINSDHRYWFTPYTLAKVVTRAGFTSLRLGFVENGVPRSRGGIRRALKQRLLRMHPALREVLVMEASFA
jgi:hypothetical protein